MTKKTTKLNLGVAIVAGILVPFIIYWLSSRPDDSSPDPHVTAEDSGQALHNEGDGNTIVQSHGDVILLAPTKEAADLQSVDKGTSVEATDLRLVDKKIVFNQQYKERIIRFELMNRSNNSVTVLSYQFTIFDAMTKQRVDGWTRTGSSTKYSPVDKKEIEFILEKFRGKNTKFGEYLALKRQENLWQVFKVILCTTYLRGSLPDTVSQRFEYRYLIQSEDGSGELTDFPAMLPNPDLINKDVPYNE